MQETFFLLFYLSEQLLIVIIKIKTVITAKDNGKPKKKIDLLKLTD